MGRGLCTLILYIVFGSYSGSYMWGATLVVTSDDKTFYTGNTYLYTYMPPRVRTRDVCTTVYRFGVLHPKRADNEPGGL